MATVTPLFTGLRARSHAVTIAGQQLAPVLVLRRSA